MILMPGFRRCWQMSSSGTTRFWTGSQSTPTSRKACVRQLAPLSPPAKAVCLPARRTEAALPPGERRLAIDAPTGEPDSGRGAADNSEILDAELVRSTTRGTAIVAGRGLGLLSRKDAAVDLVDHLRALSEAVELCGGRVDSEPSRRGEARR
jgi:hypothetical protein